MRTLSLVIALALVVACEKKAATVEPDPIKSFEKLVTTFPKRSIMKRNGNPYDIVNVTFDVKKTDSLVNPVTGIINFDTDSKITGLRSGLSGLRVQLELQMIFHWHGDHWTFERLVNRKNDADWTENILEAGAMSDFLKSVQ
jgi:hypothetical protein